MAKNKEGELSRYSGLIIGALALPVFLLFIYFGKRDIGLTASYCLVPILVAVRIRWNLRKHVWFWGVMAVVLAMHVPLIVFWRWPDRSIPGIALTPYAVADCLVVLGIIRLAERLAGAKRSEGDTVGDAGDAGDILHLK